ERPPGRGGEGDPEQRPDRESVEEGENADQGVGEGRQQVAEDDQTQAPVAVQESTDERRQQQAGEDGEERRSAGQSRRVEALEDKEDQGHARHGIGDPGQLHAGDEPRKAWELEEGAIAQPDAGPSQLRFSIRKDQTSASSGTCFVTGLPWPWPARSSTRSRTRPPGLAACNRAAILRACMGSTRASASPVVRRTGG